MSAKNFYQTLYQTDQLYRLTDESWPLSVTSPEIDSDTIATATLAPSTGSDLLAELDALTTGLSAIVPEPTLVDAVVTLPIEAPPATVPIVVTASPEPLPRSIPRSAVPPAQPSRMPQLNHKVLLLADEELDPSNLLFLEKILKAVNLNVDGVDLLNLHGAGEVDFAEMVHGKHIHHFITFGVPFSRIHLDIAMDRYQPVRFFGITFLMADSLPTIEADQNLKKRLWSALRQVFLQ